jgi:hypothetical protein
MWWIVLLIIIRWNFEYVNSLSLRDTHRFKKAKYWNTAHFCSEKRKNSFRWVAIIYISSDKFVLNKSISMEVRFNTFPLSSWCEYFFISILKNLGYRAPPQHVMKMSVRAGTSLKLNILFFMRYYTSWIRFPTETQLFRAGEVSLILYTDIEIYHIGRTDAGFSTR